MLDVTDFTIVCNEQDAPRFADWIKNRGGVARWDSALFSERTSWSTPALDENGQPTRKPTWKAYEKRTCTITNPALIAVATYREVKRFRVGLRMSSNGLSLKLTDGANRRLDKALMKAGLGATYRFDYETQEAVILVPDTVITLADWMAANTESETN